MPNITVSVRCKGVRRNKNIETLTGVILVDIDHVPLDQIEPALQLLKQDPHVLLTAHTIGGKGLRALFRMDGNSVNIFTHIFLFMNRYAKQLVHLPFDPACKNMARVSIVNYDPEVHINRNALPLRFMEDEFLQDDASQTEESEFSFSQEEPTVTPTSAVANPSDNASASQAAVNITDNSK